MDSSTATAWLSTIAACAGVGAFIDFWLGKKGTAVVNSALETFWYKMSYVNFSNIARSEIRFTFNIMLCLFGKRLLSWKRIFICIFVPIILISVVILNDSDIPEDIYVMIPIAIVSFFIGIQFNMFILRQTVYAMDKINDLLASVILVIGLIINYILLCVWPLVVLSLKVFAQTIIYLQVKMSSLLIMQPDSIPSIIWKYVWTAAKSELQGIDWSPVGQYYRIYYAIQLITMSDRTYFTISANLILDSIFPVIRIILIAIFFIILSIRPAQALILTLIDRLMSSGKPIFTVTFAAAGGLAKAFQEIEKVWLVAPK